MSDSTTTALTWRTVLRTVLIVLAVALGILVLLRIPMTVEIFIVATIIAYGINPVIRLLSKRIHRAAAIAIVYVVFLVLLLVACIIVIPTAIDQLQTLYANSGDYLASAQAFADKSQAWVNKKFGGHMLPAQLRNVEDAAVGQITTFLQVVLAKVPALVVSVVDALVVGVTAIILSYYFLVNAYSIRKFFLGMFPRQTEPKASLFLAQVQRVFGGFVGGQFILCAFCGVFTFLGLELISSAYALLLAVLTGLGYAIPYLGMFIASVVGFLLGLQQSWSVAIWTVVIMVVVTKIADTFLVPKVMGESVGVSPIGIIFAVFAGGELFGLWGVILAIPAAALFKCLWDFWIYPWLSGRPIATDAPADG